jgi:hypothetical protein
LTGKPKNEANIPQNPSIITNGAKSTNPTAKLVKINEINPDLLLLKSIVR